MERSQPSPGPLRNLSAATAFALSAALAFALLRPGAPEAGLERPPLATSGPVQLFGELARDGEGWAVRVRAVNGGADAQGCRVTAVVTELRDSPMSRVMRSPRPVWTTEVALSVRAQADAEARIAVPAATAARLRDAGDAPPPRLPARDPPPVELERETVTHAVQLQATCVARKALG